MKRESTLDRLFHRVPPEWYAVEAFFLDHCRRYPDCSIGDKPCRFYHREFTDFCDRYRLKDVLQRTPYRNGLTAFCEDVLK